MNEAARRHQALVKRFPLYEETAHWTPVIIATEHNDSLALGWLQDQGHKRGDKESRNDWLYPVNRLVLIRDPEVAMNFKLVWG